MEVVIGVNWAWTGGLMGRSGRGLNVTVSWVCSVQFSPLTDWVIWGTSGTIQPVRRLAGKQKDLGSIRCGSPFSSLQKMWFMDTVLRLCPHNS